MNSRAATTRSPEPVIIVFARAPVPGRVKTRLAAAIGDAAAARLAAQMIERAVATALAAGTGPVELHCSPDTRHRLFRRLAARHGLRLRAQRGADIGVRMHHALSVALRRAPAAILIGSDCPALRASDLRRAARLLRAGAEAVLAPAEDGGYPLIGLNRCSPKLFAGIEWGGAGVIEATRVQLRELGWSWHELRELWDVDRPEDHARLRRSRLLGRR